MAGTPNREYSCFTDNGGVDDDDEADCEGQVISNPSAAIKSAECRENHTVL